MSSFLESDSLKRISALTKTYAKDIFSAPLSKSESDQESIDTAKREIRNELEINQGGWPVDAIFRLRKIVEIGFYLGEFLLEQWQLLYVIFDALVGAKNCRSLKDTHHWNRALEQATIAINSDWFRRSLVQEAREKAVADTVKLLRKKGYRISINGYGVQIPPSEYQRICSKIESRIQRTGGLHSANALLNLMERVGRVSDQSLVHARTPQMLKQRQTSPGTPWHYIYSLCLKHINVLGHPNSAEPILRSMEELAALLASAVDVEPYSYYENMTIGGGLLSQVLRDTLIYDEMFSFPQWQPMAAQTLVPEWIQALEAAGAKLPIYPADQWALFASKLISMAHPSRIVEVQATQLALKKLPTSAAQQLLALCQCPSDDVNPDFRTPSDTPKRNASYYPVLKGPNGGLLLQPRGSTARAICERIYGLMRDAKIPDLENKMGSALERLTNVTIQNSGMPVSVVNGFYENPTGGADLEIDLAIETEDRIFLFECKKKSLTNLSRRGDTLSALSDLDGSFLRFVEQLARHEAILRKQGRIQFRCGKTISLDGRSVEKIGISLFDHGSLQHRDMTVPLLEALVGSHISLQDAADPLLERKINARLDRIAKHVRGILDAQEGRDEKLFRAFCMSTWWLSIDQLQYAILKGGDLWRGIERIRHLTQRSGDLIYDIRTLADLGPVSQALFEINKKMDNRSFV